MCLTHRKKWDRNGLRKRQVAHLLAAAALLVSAQPAASQTVINNGLAPPNPENVVDGSVARLSVQNVGCDFTVLDPCPMPWGDSTAVEVVEGGTVLWMSTRETSSVTVSGVSVDRLDLSEFSTATINNGSVGRFGFREPTVAYDSSTLLLAGGEIAYSLVAEDFSQITMSGGLVGADSEDEWTLSKHLVARGSSSATLTGGTVRGWLEATDSAVLTITGGEVVGAPQPQSSPNVIMAWGSAEVNVRGGDLGRLSSTPHVRSHDSSTITFYGGMFRIRLGGSGPLPEGDLPQGVEAITGLLESGDRLPFGTQVSGHIVLASGGTDVINNGLAPPNPENVIADNSSRTHSVFVQNVGCDATVLNPCPMPWGEATHAALVEGGVIGGFDLVVSESSGVEVSGGTIWGDLEAWDASVVEMSGGEVLGDVYVAGGADVTLRGGAIEGGLSALDAASVTVLGSGFEVDGVPVGEGPIAATTGLLTGTLASGDPLSVAFERDPGATIAVPEPGGSFLGLAALLTLAQLRRTRRRAFSGTPRVRRGPRRDHEVLDWDHAAWMAKDNSPT
jgi:hypothetical protein